MRPLLLTSHTVEGFAWGHPPIEPVCRTIRLIFPAFFATDAITGPPKSRIECPETVAERSISNTYSITGLRVIPGVPGVLVARGAGPLPAPEQPLGHLLRGERE